MNKVIIYILFMTILMGLKACYSCSVPKRYGVLAICNDVSVDYPIKFDPTSNSMHYLREVCLVFNLFNSTKDTIYVPIDNKRLVKDTSFADIKVYYAGKYADVGCRFWRGKKGNLIIPNDSVRMSVLVYDNSLIELGLHKSPLDSILKNIEIKYVRKQASPYHGELSFFIDYKKTRKHYRPQSEANVIYD